MHERINNASAYCREPRCPCGEHFGGAPASGNAMKFRKKSDWAERRRKERRRRRERERKQCHGLRSILKPFPVLAFAGLCLRLSDSSYNVQRGGDEEENEKAMKTAAEEEQKRRDLVGRSCGLSVVAPKRFDSWTFAE